REQQEDGRRRGQVDYFLRDCHGLGINVTFEYERLVHFSRAAEVEGEWQIVFKESEAENLYEMNHARMMLHKKAYQHRVVKIIDRMLVDALLEADKYEDRNGQSFKLSEVCNDLAAYTYLTDDVMYQILRMPSGSPHLEKAKLILQNILTRNLYSYVGEFTEADVIDVEKTKQTLMNTFPGAECLEKRVKFGSENGNPLAKQHFYRRGNRGGFITLRPEQVSRMLPREFEDVKFYVITKDYRAEQDTSTKIKKEQIAEFLEVESSLFWVISQEHGLHYQERDDQTPQKDWNVMEPDCQMAARTVCKPHQLRDP
ncbi:deoxynucleoside triphosphate triphosphohydrolase SAMHD1-like, partial [Penaeus indicus]|uniref:deoxynucleoside triphosphate triphosphohydrolase SAMHD1-like n=1 Tax=Penaeus indicus TaxID=29960 RepID=UPI00300DBAE5